MKRICLAIVGSIVGLAMVVAGVSAANAATAETVDFYLSAPNVMNTYVDGAVVETFNTFNTGSCPTSWPTVGTITVSGSGNGCRITNANTYGGATAGATGAPVNRPSGSGTRYVSVESNSTVTLSLSRPETYLGFWWSAGDANNSIKLYSGGTDGKLVGSFSTASLVAMLNNGSGTIESLDGTTHRTCDYYGNPVLTTATCGGGREPFAYVHLIGTGGLNFDTVVFTQGSSGGFEFDNMAIARFVQPSEQLISFPPNLVVGQGEQHGTACSPFLSNLDWTASNFASAPVYTLNPTTLPQGLTFSATSGEIAGIPTETIAHQTYTVTATAGSQHKSATFTLDVDGSTPCVNPIPPTIIASNTPLITDTCGVYRSGLDWIASDFTGTPSYSVTPALPSGLTFDSTTGEFSGKPTTASSMTTYTVTATADLESATSTFEFAVYVHDCSSPLPDTGLSQAPLALLALTAIAGGTAIVLTRRLTLQRK